VGGGGIGRPALKADLTAVSRLSRICGDLDVSQSYGPSRTVTGIDLLFKVLMNSRSLSTECGPQHPAALNRSPSLA
jgi:hypothetical protein